MCIGHGAIVVIGAFVAIIFIPVGDIVVIASVVVGFFLNHPHPLFSCSSKRYCFFMCMHYTRTANFSFKNVKGKRYEQPKMLNC